MLAGTAPGAARAPGVGFALVRSSEQGPVVLGRLGHEAYAEAVTA